ncbi:hypothetical protein [Rhodococcus jostii]|uniref:hypothetical protein n=1 Tax=Rhodococcus jostii TaxID=132919 RepID=UPI001F0862F7|nr:hypothetical protein [Rhodococcus jostii]
MLDILANLTRAHDLSLLVISHDAAVADTLADDVVDMDCGRRRHGGALAAALP